MEASMTQVGIGETREVCEECGAVIGTKSAMLNGTNSLPRCYQDGMNSLPRGYQTQIK
jgi:hypothetical protein